MCGIVGKINFSDNAVEPSLIKRMADTIIHRGPDDEGVRCIANIGLGQRRLAIIDLRRDAAPPLSNEDETIWVVFNGEIYNFRELRDELLKRGHTFRTSSDTEVIIHLYEEHGTGCLKYMRGMFAFALWDGRKQQLFAARDRLGKKPFFYCRTNSSLVFASEIKAIMADRAISSSPNFEAIDAYLTCQYVPSPQTAFVDINKLPPAHYLTCDSCGTVEINQYWSANGIRKFAISIDEAEYKLTELLRESIRLRMISDVPLGAFLSGGIDSGTVVALMSMESSAPIKTFSIGFEEHTHNELPYARLVAERYNTDHHEFIVKPDAASVIPQLVKHYNEPFADSSALPTYHLSKVTRQCVTVALSGDGGDESFGGYQRYNELAHFGLLDAVPQQLRSAMLSPIEALLNKGKGVGVSARLARGVRLLRSNLGDRYRSYMAIVKEKEKSFLYTDQMKSLIAGRTTANDAWNVPFENGDNNYEWMMRHDQTHYLPDCLMVKTDIASMANSLEVRCPLLDHKLVEFAAEMPTSYKISGSNGKIILRRIAQGLLPEQVVRKEKTGFAVPLARWFRHDLSHLLRSTLLDDTARKRGMFRGEAVRQMVEDHLMGKRDWSNRLWAFLMLELWFREFID